MEHGRVPNRAPEATRAEKGKTQNFEEVLQISLIFEVGAPKTGPKTGPKRGLSRVIHAASARRPLGGLLAFVAVSVPLFGPPVGLLERSWKPPGPNKSALERLLGAPREISRQFSTILKAERLPKWSPGGSQIEPQRRLELKRAKPQNFEDVYQHSLVFKVPGSRRTG